MPRLEAKRTFGVLGLFTCSPAPLHSCSIFGGVEKIGATGFEPATSSSQKLRRPQCYCGQKLRKFGGKRTLLGIVPACGSICKLLQRDAKTYEQTRYSRNDSGRKRYS